jgi:hypothetical protein
LEEAGYPKGFFDELRAEAEALVHMTGGAARARNERGRVTADIAEALKEGMRTVTVIEGLVMRSFCGPAGDGTAVEEPAAGVAADRAAEAAEGLIRLRKKGQGRPKRSLLSRAGYSAK